MDWDYTQDGPETARTGLTVLGAEVGEVFLEDAKHRRSERATAAPETLARALIASRRVFTDRARQHWPPRPERRPVAGDDAPAVPAVVPLLHDACAAALGGTVSAGVELLVVEETGRVARVVPGIPGWMPALPLSPARHDRLRAGLPGAGAEGRARPCTVVVVAYPERLVLAAREAGATCPPSRAHRRVLIEAGALLEGASRRLASAGMAVAPGLQFFDDELHAALGLGGVTDVAVGALLVDLPVREGA